MTRTSAFEIILLVVGVGAAYLGFAFINNLYLEEGEFTWLMLVSIFLWLIMILQFILMSLNVNISKNQLEEIRNISRLTRLIEEDIHEAKETASVSRKKKR